MQPVESEERDIAKVFGAMTMRETFTGEFLLVRGPVGFGLRMREVG